MKILTARDAKHGFDRLSDLVCTEPVVVAKHGRSVVVAIAVKKFEDLMAPNSLKSAKWPRLSANEE